MNRLASSGTGFATLLFFAASISKIHAWMILPTTKTTTRYHDYGSFKRTSCLFADPTEGSAAARTNDEWETADENGILKNTKVLEFLETRYPLCYKLLWQDNERVLPLLQEFDTHTLFVVADSVLEDSVQQQQLLDPRNGELRQQMGAYHLISQQSVSAAQLRAEDWRQGRSVDGSPPDTVVSAIQTVAGQVPVGRRRATWWTNLLQSGNTKDGAIVIGPSAQIVQSFQLKSSASTIVIHEMDALISPEILWRYADQLRLPGF